MALALLVRSQEGDPPYYIYSASRSDPKLPWQSRMVKQTENILAVVQLTSVCMTEFIEYVNAVLAAVDGPRTRWLHISLVVHCVSSKCE